MNRHYFFSTAILTASILAASMASAEVTFPDTRKAVADGEYYLQDSNDTWGSWCIRDKNGEDTCEASTGVEDLNAGLQLDFAVIPYVSSLKESSADVDVAPRALLAVSPLSTAKHYENFSAAITSVDGVPYDAFWCALTEIDDCNRGPELPFADLKTLLDGKTATISIYDRDDSPDAFTLKSSIEVDLSGLRQAFESATAFEDEIYGNDAASVFPTELCTLQVNGDVKRLSYTFDEDFDTQNTSISESLRGPHGSGNCPSYVSLAYLTPDMTPAQREMLCLVYDEKGNLSGFQEGDRDSRRACKKPSKSFCERVNDSKEAALAISGFAATTVGTATGTATVTGTTVVAHSSGAAILTGSSGYVAGTLGTIGTTALGILTAPPVVVTATVSVLAVGGAVYICSGD